MYVKFSGLVGNKTGNPVPRLRVEIVNQVTVFHVPVTKVGAFPVVGVTAKLKAGHDGRLRVQPLLQLSLLSQFPSSHCS